jgi:hypothetical protein
VHHRLGVGVLPADVRAGLGVGMLPADVLCACLELSADLSLSGPGGSDSFSRLLLALVRNLRVQRVNERDSILRCEEAACARALVRVPAAQVRSLHRQARRRGKRVDVVGAREEARRGGGGAAPVAEVRAEAQLLG